MNRASPLATRKASPAPPDKRASRRAHGLGARLLRPDLVLVVAAAAAAAWITTRSLDAKSLWIDEALSESYAHRSLRGLFDFFVHGELNMALYHLLLHFWLRLGDSEVAIRTLSVLFAVVALPFAYALGARLLSPRAGAIAALLLALNGTFYSFAREARSYSLAIFFIVATSFFFVRALDRGHSRDWLAYVLSAVLAVYVHLFAMFVLLAHLLSLACWRGRPIDRRRVTLAAIAILGLLSPAFAYVVTGDTSLTTDQNTRARDVVDLFRWYAVGNLPLLILYVSAALAALAAAARRFRRHGGATAAWPELFLGIWIAVPVAGALVVSYTVDPIFEFRYLLLALPAFILLAADGIALLTPVALFALLVVVASAVSLRSLDLCRPGCATPTQDFRGATAFVGSRAEPADEILFDPGYLGYAFSYYAKRIGGPSPSESPSSATRRAWVLIDEGDPNSSRYRRSRGPLGSRWRLVRVKRFEARLVTELYVRRP